MSNAVSDAQPAPGKPSTEKQSPTEPQVPKSWLRQIYEFVSPIAILLFVLCAARSSLYDWNDVPSGSMLPTILEGDRVLVNKLAYDLKFPFTTWHIAQWGGPQRGDIVVFFSPEPVGTRLIKRCVGLPGDQLQVINNQIFINGVAQTSVVFNPSGLTYIPQKDKLGMVYFSETIGTHTHIARMNMMGGPNRHFGPVTIPPGKYFMLGDNRDNSRDSRFFNSSGSDQSPGTPIFVDRANIVGRASRVAFSLDYGNYWIPRWKRFFEALP